MKAFDLDRIGGRRALSALVDEVCRAGEEALSLFRAGVLIEKKPDRSPVTNADQRVEARLRGFLARTFPDHGFLGEESGESEGKAAFRWIVDPIDGTRAFMRGLPSWSLLVGLEAEGVPVVGVSLLPALGALFVGVRGDGATRDGRPLRVSSIERLEDAMIMHGGLEQFTEQGRSQMLIELGRRAYSARGFADMMGHAAVLEGKADAVVDPRVKPWDLCAVAVLLREAGGRLTDFNGNETIYGGDALATNGRIHDELLALVSSDRWSKMP
ncbi:MAG: hypothetical protein HUU20_06465 [Pirellulales bacterium]|nr:hypothetical protein [Deltaproteobacteria bacterium]NUQ62111.1 hypothetical protein [Pirellulales bacterium]